MGLFKKVKGSLNPGNLLRGNVFNPVGTLFGINNPILNPAALTDEFFKIPVPPAALANAGKQFNVDLRVNAPALGQPKTEIFGQALDWPVYVSTPYREFVNHDEVFNVYLHLSVGVVSVLGIFLGKTPVFTFPYVQTELCLPGVDMTLIRPNVYTASEVQGVELPGGSDGASDPDDIITVVVDSRDLIDDDILFDNPTATIRTSHTGLFDPFRTGDVIQCDDTGPNEGTQFSILAVFDEGRALSVSPAPVSHNDDNGCVLFLIERRVGPYPACPPGAQIESGAVDIEFAALFDDSNPTNTRFAGFVLQYRAIDDAGNVIGPGTWTDIEFTLSGNQNKAQRFTQEFTLSGPMRPEIRLWRESPEQNDADNPSSACQWTGLKGYIIPLAGDAPAADAFCTRLALQVRSSGMLSAAASREVNVLMQRWLPIYESGGWSDPLPTRNPVWAAAYGLTAWSKGKVDLSRLDVAEFVAQANGADSRGDTFDATIERKIEYWEAVRAILRVARARPVRDTIARKITISRDELSDPVAMFCDGWSSVFGNDSINLPDADTPGGVLVKITEPKLWTSRAGPLVGDSTDVREVDFLGATTYDQAWREAQFEYRDLYYRFQSLSIDTEMDSLLLRYGQRVLLASKAKRWGQCGEVTAQDADPAILTLEPPVTFTPGLDHYLYLQDEDGSIEGPIACTEGVDPGTVVLDTPPGVTLRLGASWRTLFAFGHNGDEGEGIFPDAPRIAIVQERTSNGPRGASLSLLLDHPFVYEDPGPAPDDPFAIGGTIPDLTISGLTAEQDVDGALEDPNGDPIRDPNGDLIFAPGISAGVVVSIEWDPVTGASLYQARWKYDVAVSWTLVYSGLETSTQFGVPANGTVQVQVQAFSNSYVGTPAETSVVVDAY